jgi:rhodanese-related sulfurtransferase
MLDHEVPIVVVAEPGGEDEAVMRLGRIGFDNVAGTLTDGMAALAARDDLVERTDRITAQALAEWIDGGRVEAGPAPTVVDVRSEAEYAGGHIRGAINIPLPRLGERIDEVPAGRAVAVHCEGGYRSAIAASLLQKIGRHDVRDLVGGYKAWLAAGLPTATGGQPRPA